MCGIAGFIDETVSEDKRRDLIGAMLYAIKHRGPDASSYEFYEKVTLGHNRLKIIDLSDVSNQPFEYDDVAIIFNGEIYNYIELRDELRHKGLTFRTTGDTEVICAAYKYWGTSCVEHFIGMWSFALWDKGRRQLFCSRDRFGIKPFYYFTDRGRLWFASEIKALKLVPSFQGDLNLAMIDRGVAFGWCDYKDETIYSRIKVLPPASNMIWKDGEVSFYAYWDISDANITPATNMTWEAKKERFRELFFESVKLHARADVPNGICLSGGLDSSAIASVFSEIYPDTLIKSFTIYFEGKNKVDERPFVKEVIKKYPNIQPYYSEPTHAQVADYWHTAAWHSDIPMWGSSHLAGFFVMQMAKENGVTVVNDGQGADEYLGGYLHSVYRLAGNDFRHFKFAKGLDLINNLASREHWDKAKRNDFIKKSIAATFSGEQQMYRLEYNKYKKYLTRDLSISLERKFKNPLNDFLYHLIFHATLQPILFFEDRKSMAFSIESRVPFLNHKLVEFAFSLSNEDKINQQGETKYILRSALSGILPQAISARKDKKGFVTPGEVEWLNGPLKFLLDIDYSRLEFLNTSIIRKEIEQYKKGDHSKATLAWRVACLHYWLKEFN
ncbi:MAG: asparagine synthase (glutamine-hydrolyzing) [Bacteroidetes bacterium]|nr:asparagine synthase (glutamine-hydrolyzing) [Bacteroidota bacterium]